MRRMSIGVALGALALGAAGTVALAQDRGSGWGGPGWGGPGGREGMRGYGRQERDDGLRDGQEWGGRDWRGQEGGGSMREGSMRGGPERDGSMRGGSMREGARDGGRDALSAQDRDAFMDARLAALRAGLRLTADQDKLWPPVEEAIRAVARQRDEARAIRRERWASMRESGPGEIPERLRFASDRMLAAGEALRRLADATAPFHASLDEGQKRRLAVLTRFMEPQRGGGDGRGQRWREERMRGPDGMRGGRDPDRDEGRGPRP